MSLARSLNVLIPLALVIAATGGSSYDPAKRHHTPQGFRNNYPHPAIGGSFWKWQWERWRMGLPKTPPNGWRFPVLEPEIAAPPDGPGEARAIWIGHATVLIQLAGRNILTDPHFTGRASPVSFAGPERITPPAVAIEALPHIDAVLISHNHYDHLDRESVVRLAAQPGGPPRFFVPLGLREWLAAEGIETATELDWWEQASLGDLAFHLVPVQHWSARGVNDRNRTLWGGWVVEALGFRAFFAGDTGYSKDFADIHARFGGFDLALLPIGAYEPRWFMRTQHVNPEEAVRIHQDIGARRSLAIHWGTFVLTDEPMDEPPQKLAQALAAAGLSERDFTALPHGGTLAFSPAR